MTLIQTFSNLIFVVMFVFYDRLYRIKTVHVQGHRVTLQMWDTAGQEKFKSTMSSFYRNVDGVIVVFDITNMNSFADIESWFVEVQHHNTNNIFGLLVGNKRDIMFRRVVDPHLAADLANRLGVSYIETSAKDSTNVSGLFDAMVQSLIQSRVGTGHESPAAPVVAEKVNVQPSKQQKTCSQRSCSLL